MKKTNNLLGTSIFILVVLFFAIACGNSTNNEENKTDVTTQTDEKDTKVVNIPDNKIPEPPAEIISLAAPLNIDIRNSAYYWLKAVKETDYKDYKEFYVNNNSLEYPAVLIAYGLFNLGDNMDPKINESGNKDIRECSENGQKENLFQCYLKSFKQKVMYKIYSSDILQEAAYNWLLPEWKLALASMETERKQLIKEILNHMIKYTQNYNYQNELAFYNQCKGEKEYLFTSTFSIVNNEIDETKGTTKPYRKAEAWVFRRVHQKHMTAAEINQWLKRIKKDLSL